MFVCICNAIRDSELREAAVACCGDAESIYVSLGRPPQCRQCIDDAEAIIAEVRTRADLPVLAAH